MKIPRSEYEITGAFPVIDQGKEYSAGFTTDESKLYRGQIPLVLFGDHTREIKFVNQPFALGADGVKALEPKPFLTAKFLYYYLLKSPVEARGYSRHFKYLKEKRVPLPPLPEQHRIVEILDQADTLRQQRREADQLSQKMLSAIFNEIFGDPNSNERKWPILPLDEAFDDVSRLGNKIPRSHYLVSGEIPVVDQGQDEIAGYWNEVGDAYHGQLPVILFGDHTRIFKLLDYPFCIGADGVRLLRPKTMDCHFAFGLLTLLDVPSRGYSRHFKELRSLAYIDPPPDQQERFSKALAEARKLSAKANTSAATLETLFQTLLHRAFDGSLTAKWREGHAKEVLQEMERTAR